MESQLLMTRARRAIEQSQMNAELPISCGSWSRDLYFMLCDAFPKYKFEYINGTIWLFGNPIQAVHGSLAWELVDAIKIFCPTLRGQTERSLTYSVNTEKRPDMTLKATRSRTPHTVVEIVWAHETTSSLITELRVASAAGFNAIGLQVWFDGKRGDTAALPRLGDLTQEMVAKASILFVIMPAWSAHGCVWRLGQFAAGIDVGSGLEERPG